MKKILAAAALATMLLPSASFAATVLFPSAAPVAQITIPDAWNPEETDSGIQASSDDGAIYLSIDVASAETTDKVIEDVFSFLGENGVTVDPATQKQSEDTFNGMKMINLDWSGKDKDGAVSIGVSLVAPKPDKLLVITYWGTKGEQEKHGPELVALISSLKPAK
ncbi:histidine kinase [Neorhizobium sp. BETTINA12A]|uniref:histidine kinase n=1 Tax=Neorhizobium sp. BETTINA12A TaxID=2908924 RepID=UPI001FF31C3A|nr:histidine kinase [Neorhizobium sp. BETTINA12A]MCJ9753070.1 histidine kinase [Neorhizobium sp. BETTINA12A]